MQRLSLHIKRLLRIGERPSTENSNLTSATDPFNGFGATSLLRSLACSNSVESQLIPHKTLSDVQILTRYCATELPYWEYFLEHYYHLGASIFHVCVQSDEDLHALEHFRGLLPVDIIAHRLDDSLDPAEALKTLNLLDISATAEFTLLVDADEFFQPLRPNLSIRRLFNTFPQINQFYIPWLMRPLVNAEDYSKDGFWGHIGKPVARSNTIVSILSDHRFEVQKNTNVKTETSAPCGVFGFALVHYWSRSFNDCLLKIFNNRFNDSKSQDSSEAISLIRTGILPIRLRLLAYLSVQDGYVEFPLRACVIADQECEEIMLQNSLREDDAQEARKLFERYSSNIFHRQKSLPLYPAISLQKLAIILPPTF